jgi:hypothetical protein
LKLAVQIEEPVPLPAKRLEMAPPYVSALLLMKLHSVTLQLTVPVPVP